MPAKTGLAAYSINRSLIVLGLGAFLSGHAQAATQCAPTTGAQQAVILTIQKMMDALRNQNDAAYRELLAPEFSAYDGGEQLNQQSFWDLVARARASGKKFEWSVTEPEVHVDCNMAWIRYINDGSVEDASGKKPVKWLESGVFEYRRGRWTIAFVHSTRATAR